MSQFAKTVASENPEAKLVPGRQSLEQNLKLLQWVGRVTMAWPYLESQIGFTLAFLLNANPHVAMAILSALPSSRAQRDVLGKAGEAVLTDQELELFRALMRMTGSLWSERNRFAHWLWVTSPDIPDAFLLAKPEMWQRARGEQIRLWLAADAADFPEGTRPAREPDPKHVWIYRRDTFSDIRAAVYDLSVHFGSFCKALDPKLPQTERDEVRARLYREPDIEEVILKSRGVGRSAQKSPPPVRLRDEPRE